jgi:Protein of unknown function (DUF1064)
MERVVHKLLTEPLRIEYIPDFEYNENGVHVVADAKGMRTTEYNKKKTLMKSLLGIEIKEFYDKDVK